MTAPDYLRADQFLARLMLHQGEEAAFGIVERAAIMEFCGKATRDRAEAGAMMAERRKRAEGVML